ncbi:MAG: cytidine deaminase [Bacteroides sp.]|nr:cytidine deaminase [Bacteroides sp.]
MKDLTITAVIKVFQFEELTATDQNLIIAAKDATNKSYAPYSNFAVGAAARLKNGTIVIGSNQENAAYPSGLCAERTALFYANSEYPHQPVETLAVAARNQKGFLNEPIPPCGACRQVMLETENRFNQPFRILLYGTDEIYEIKSVQDLLPLSFSKTNMD